MKLPRDTESRLTKFLYGVGAIAYGVKDNGFSYLLLLFYNQVLGLPQQWVGAGIFAVLFIDALSDPIVGSLSDNYHSRWGRRHPFMYASLLPVAISYYLLWNPPEGLPDSTLFAWFLVTATMVRLFITLYEIPSSSLVAELTDDYHQRTAFLGYRHFFGWWGGLTMSVTAYAFFLVPTEEQPIGVLNRDGYAVYGLVSSAVMFLAVLLSSLGTHRHIPALHKPPVRVHPGFGEIFSETLETLKNKSFFALFVAAIFGAMAVGLSASMNVYMASFYWEFDNEQLSLISLSLFGAAFLAFHVAPLASRRFGKKHAAITIGVSATCLAVSPYLLRSIDFFPANGTPSLFYIILAINFIDVTLIVSQAILVDSMIADVVEESELRTGRRSEGVFFAARSLVRKSVSGVGVVMATTLLTIIQFPEDAVPGEVDPEIIFNLGIAYAPLIFTLYMLMLLVMFSYRISQSKHEANLEQLAQREIPG